MLANTRTFAPHVNAILEDDVDAVAFPSVIAPGNVQELAECRKGLLNRVTEPYSRDWDECLARANQERDDEARPALVESVENLDQKIKSSPLGTPILSTVTTCLNLSQ